MADTQRLTGETGSERTASGRGRPPRTLRLQLLLPVNTLLLIGIAILLAVDYRIELNGRLAEAQLALQDEAATLSAGIAALRHHSVESIQGFVDSVCDRMNETSSPGHHIAVRLNDLVVQARVHGRASPELFAAMEAAAASPGNPADGSIVLGSDRRGGLAVYVSERAGEVLRRARGSLARRTLGLAAIGILAALVINLILVRLVTRPLGGLVRTVRQIGAGHVGVQAGRFRTAELASLAGEIDSMSSSLADAAREREGQFSKARRIQEHLSPHVGQVPGLRLARLYEPATEITGDYHDLIEQADGSWLFCLADVCGHGVPAAMGAAVLKTLLLSASEESLSPGRILASINKHFGLATLPEDFASMILVRWHPFRNQIDYASAGHETCYCRIREGTVLELTSTGLVLGVEPDGSWPTESFSVCPGTRLILLTDGVAETIGGDGRLFGRQRTRRFFLDHHTESPASLIEAMGRALANHRCGRASRDDVTILAIEFTDQSRPAPCESGPISSSAVRARSLVDPLTVTAGEEAVGTGALR